MLIYKVKEVAELAGISVRTLHYYDNIGLLTPTHVGGNGYHLYNEKDLVRLQQILFFKELNFSLQDIKAILDNPNFDRKSALYTHKQVLIDKKHRLERIIQSIDQTIQSIEGGEVMGKKICLSLLI